MTLCIQYAFYKNKNTGLIEYCSYINILINYTA